MADRFLEAVPIAGGPRHRAQLALLPGCRKAGCCLEKSAQSRGFTYAQVKQHAVDGLAYLHERAEVVAGLRALKETGGWRECTQDFNGGYIRGLNEAISVVENPNHFARKP